MYALVFEMCIYNIVKLNTVNFFFFFFQEWKTGIFVNTTAKDPSSVQGDYLAGRPRQMRFVSLLTFYVSFGLTVWQDISHRQRSLFPFCSYQMPGFKWGKWSDMKDTVS